MGYISPKQIYTPSPYSDNINGNGRIDEYAHDIPQIPVSWQPYTGNSNIQFDKNARLNVRFAVPQVIVTRSPYDRLNSGNSNYDKNTARKNNSDSYPIDIYDDYSDDADFVMGYYYDIGDDEYYYYIVDNYYGNNIIYYDENEDNYLLDVNALNALNANDEDNSYLINSPYGLAYYASKNNNEESSGWSSAWAFGSSFIPIYGDYKAFAEAETGWDYTLATVGIIWKPARSGRGVKAARAVRIKKTKQTLEHLAGAISNQIANGHAFNKHISEFKHLNITTKQQFAKHINNIIKKPSETKKLSNGRTAYWDKNTKTVVIHDPKSKDGGTAFIPTNGKKYFDGLI